MGYHARHWLDHNEKDLGFSAFKNHAVYGMSKIWIMCFWVRLFKIFAVTFIPQTPFFSPSSLLLTTYPMSSCLDHSVGELMLISSWPS